MSDTPLTPTRLELLQALFERALEQPDAERAALLAAAAPDDPALRAEVLGLIRAHDRVGALRSPLSVSPLAGTVGAGGRPGSRVGAYEVVRLVGAGGMGDVYEGARADAQYHKRVAIKFLHPHAASASALERFRAERQILATLNHPGIAALLDGGVTDDGQPYIVMEYIDGAPITAWCETHRLSIRDRLGLFLQVVGAVQSAHRALIVHRDLKPGNILVASDGRVKLLDFGIAKILRTDAAGELPLTRSDQRSFTPEYAAPEQVRGLPVGTSADIYALGVVLFELLTGHRPHDLRGKLLVEIEQIVCNMPAPKPSSLIDDAAVAQLGERSARRARARIEGDLDAIVAVALRTEPERRYGSADALGLEVRRHLDGHPVSARPDTLRYRVGKLVRRRRLETAAFVFAALSLIAGFVGVTIQANRAAAQGRRAAQVTGFLSTMLGSADPASLGRDVTIREVLDSAAIRADTLRAEPALEAEVRKIIGDTYMALGEFEAGEAQFRRALDAHRVHAPAGDYETATALIRQSRALEFLGRYGEADSVLRIAAPLFERFPHADPLDEIDIIDHRARILERLGRSREAEVLLERALALTLRHAPGIDSNLAYAYVNLGFSKSELGKTAEAESLYAAGVGAARRAYGPEHPVVASMMSPYATVLDRAGKRLAADSVFREVLAMRRKLLGPEHPDYAWTMFNYATLLMEQERYAESVVWAREVLKLRGASLPDTHPAIATAMGVLGRALAGMDSLAAGERWLRESLQLREKTLPAEHWLIASSRSILGAHLALSGRFEEAEALMLPAERKLVEIRGDHAPAVADARGRLVALYKAWGRPAVAAEWQARITAAAASR